MCATGATSSTGGHENVVDAVLIPVKPDHHFAQPAGSTRVNPGSLIDIPPNTGDGTIGKWIARQQVNFDDDIVRATFFVVCCDTRDVDIESAFSGSGIGEW